MTLVGGQIGRTLVKNVLSVNGGGGTGGVAVISTVESMSCLGECIMDVCEGKAMEDSIRGVCQVWVIIICTNIHSYRIQRRGVEILFVQQIAGGDTLLEFQLQPLVLKKRHDTGSWRGVLVRKEEGKLHRNGGRVLG